MSFQEIFLFSPKEIEYFIKIWNKKENEDENPNNMVDKDFHKNRYKEAYNNKRSKVEKQMNKFARESKDHYEKISKGIVQSQE